MGVWCAGICADTETGESKHARLYMYALMGLYKWYVHHQHNVSIEMLFQTHRDVIKAKQ